MIHLFYVSNYISFSNYLQIIDLNNLDVNDCYFYSPRIEKNNLNLNADLNFISLPKTENLFGKLLFIKKCIRNFKFKKTINNLLDFRNFTLYVPHLINLRERLLISNAFCIKYYFVEEGFPAYRKDLNFKHKDYSLTINNRNLTKIQPLGQCNKKYKGCYANFNQAFPFLNNKKIIPLNFKHKWKKTIKHPLKNDDIVIAVDSKMSFSDINNYLISLQKLSNEINAKKIFLKFHMDFKYEKEIKAQIIEIFKSSNLEVEILKDNIYIEEVSERIKINLYCISTSLIIYESINKSKIYLFNEITKNYDAKQKHTNAIYEDIIEKLNLKINYVTFK